MTELRDYHVRKSARGRGHLSLSQRLKLEQCFLDGKRPIEAQAVIKCARRTVAAHYARFRLGETFLTSELVAAVSRVVAARKPNFYKSDFAPS